MYISSYAYCQNSMHNEYNAKKKNKDRHSIV